jgi:hypothetical protein
MKVRKWELGNRTLTNDNTVVYNGGVKYEGTYP